MLSLRYLLLGLALLLAACEAETPTDTPEPKGYDHFTVDQIRTAAQLRQKALAESDAYSLLQSLVAAAPKRLPGSPGDAGAVAWAVAALEASGFDKVWTEPVTLQGWGRESASFEVIGPEPAELSVTSLGYSPSTPPNGIEAELVRLETYQELVEADPALVQGKIVYIANRMERTRDGRGYVAAVPARTSGPSEAGRKGALALVIRSIGTDETDAPHTGLTVYEDDAPKIPAAALSNRAADALERIIAGGEPVRARLELENRDLGEITTYNVIGELTGAERPGEIVAIGGHLDAWDLGEGAIDDGYGVATTLAAGRLIAALPGQPSRTLRVIAFAAEEVGLHGGKAYAAAHGSEDHVIAMESDFGVGKVWQLRPIVDESAVPVLREMWRLVAPMGVSWGGDNQGFIGADLIDLAKGGLAGAQLVGDGTRYFDLHHSANDTLAEATPEDMNTNTAVYAALTYLALEYQGRFDRAE